MRINLKAERGTQVVSRGDGLVIAEKLLKAMEKEDKVIIDFDNILIASVSFLDEAFCKLAFKYPKEKLIQKLAFENIEEYDKALINDILISRYHQKELEVEQRDKKKTVKN
jgi:FMN phosphatase YigB (HAD superfamily)